MTITVNGEFWNVNGQNLHRNFIADILDINGAYQYIDNVPNVHIKADCSYYESDIIAALNKTEIELKRNSNISACEIISAKPEYPINYQITLRNGKKKTISKQNFISNYCIRGPHGEELVTKRMSGNEYQIIRDFHALGHYHILSA